MRLLPLNGSLPGLKNAVLALISAILLILAFPDFDYWFLAWFALVPLMWSVEREKESTGRCFVIGWIFGTAFFFGTCWWLTYAPITYAGFPPILAYFLLFCVCLVAGLFPAMFAAVLSVLLRRFGSLAFLAAPFVWVFTEFLRYWITGNNWNALGYSQAFSGVDSVRLVSIGGISLLSFYLAGCNSFFALAISIYRKERKGKLAGWLTFAAFATAASPLLGLIFLLADRRVRWGFRRSFARKRLVIPAVILPLVALFFGLLLLLPPSRTSPTLPLEGNATSYVIAIQPNVPMDGLDKRKWEDFRRRHSELAQRAQPPNFGPTLRHLLGSFDYEDREQLLKKSYDQNFVTRPKTVIFPESPMNFMYETDPETREFIDGFARKNNVSVLFNSAEPDPTTGKFFNSAVMVGPQGGEVAQYDKIYLLPFGEAVPFPLEGILPGFVGNFSYGKEYDLLPVGDAKAGVMICFESHFGALSREYVRNGADVIIEMTNDGYLGPTPVLRQHLANAIFRAVETNRPVLRVTNVGITAYINERGEVLDAAEPYTDDTRVWSVAKSNGSQTFYVRYGDWFAWLSSLVTIGLLGFAVLPVRNATVRERGDRDA